MREINPTRLQVSVSRLPGAVSVHVRGKLIYPWTRVLRAKWQEARTNLKGERRTVDLSGVRQIDADGADLLREMMRGGFRVVAQDAALKDLIESIETQIREANIVLEFDLWSHSSWPRLRVMSR